MLDGFLRPDDAARVAVESSRADSARHDAPGPRRHGPRHRSRHGDGRAQYRRGIVDVGLGRCRRRLQGSAVSGVGEPARSARACVGRQAVRASDEEGGRQAARVHHRSAAGEVADDLPPRAGTASAEPPDRSRRRTGAGDDSRARHSRGQQLRHAEKERFRRLLLRAEDRDVAGSAAGRDALEERGRGARACRAAL